MRESLRLGPTAPARGVTAAEDTVIGGKYAIKKGTLVIVNTYPMHRDPKVWGEDVSVLLGILQDFHMLILSGQRLTRSNPSACSTGSSKLFL